MRFSRQQIFARVGGRILAGLCFVGLVASLARGDAPQGENTHAKLHGEGTLIYFELSHPEKLIDLGTHPKLWDAVQQINGVKRFLASEQFKQLRGAVEIFEGKLGQKWEPALRELIGGGVSLSVEPLSGTGLLVIKSRKAELLNKLNDALREVAEAEAANQGRPSPIKSQKYSGLTGWSFGKGEAHVIIDDVLAISNQEGPLKAAVDRQRGDEKRSLADAADYQQARKSLPSDRIGWGFARIAPARLIPGVTKALDSPGDNPVAEFLGAGILEALKSAPYVTVSMHLDANEYRLRAQMPFQQSKTVEKRKWFFAPEPEKAAYVPLKPKRTIHSTTIHRDLSGLWLQREKLFNDEVITGLAQADSGLGLYFSGRDFGTEVLGALTSRMQLVVARQQFPADEPKPAVKLPAFAWVLEMKDPADFAKHLLLGYQKVIGLTNVIGGMNGQPQMLLDAEEYQGVKVWRGKFLPTPNTDAQKAPIQFNFSPACATVGNRFVLASTVGLAHDLIDELKKPSATQTTADLSNSVTDLTELAAILGDNQDALVSQRMLQEGGSREQAAAQVKLLLDALKAVRTSGLRLASSRDQLWMELSVGLPKYGE